MITKTRQIPVKQATMIRVPAEEPKIIGPLHKPRIVFSNIEVPQSIRGDFLELCQLYNGGFDSRKAMADGIKRATSHKEIYLRFAGEKPLGAVSGRFKEISAQELAEEVRKVTDTKPTIRYAQNQERIIASFPISDKLSHLRLTFDSGEYGTYSGSGSSAARYGLSSVGTFPHRGRDVENWTHFLSDAIKETHERAIHLKGDMLEQRLQQIKQYGPQLDERIEKSKEDKFTSAEVKQYLRMYANKGINQFVREAVERTISGDTSAYSLSTMLSTAAAVMKNPADKTVLRLEYLAGEAMLCYASIKKELEIASQKKDVA